MIDSISKLVASVFGTQDGDGKVYHPSKTCPECGSKLCAEKGSENWRCPNPDCPAQVRCGLVHWCSPEVMNIPCGDMALVAKLVGKGLARDVAELYRLKADEIATLDGMDKDAAQQFFDAITASMRCDAWRLLFGLNIPLVGAEEARALGRGFPTVDAVFTAGVSQLTKNSGISEAAAQSLVHWHGDPINRKLVVRLRKAGLKFKSDIFNLAGAGGG